MFEGCLASPLSFRHHPSRNILINCNMQKWCCNNSSPWQCGSVGKCFFGAKPAQTETCPEPSINGAGIFNPSIGWYIQHCGSRCAPLFLGTHWWTLKHSKTVSAGIFQISFIANNKKDITTTIPEQHEGVFSWIVSIICLPWIWAVIKTSLDDHSDHVHTGYCTFTYPLRRCWLYDHLGFLSLQYLHSLCQWSALNVPALWANIQTWDSTARHLLGKRNCTVPKFWDRIGNYGTVVADMIQNDPILSKASVPLLHPKPMRFLRIQISPSCLLHLF